MYISKRRMIFQHSNKFLFFYLWGRKTLNNIEIRKVHKGGNWYDFEWFIDGIRLSKYLIDRKNVELPYKVELFDDLCPAWTKKLDYAGMLNIFVI